MINDKQIEAVAKAIDECISYAPHQEITNAALAAIEASHAKYVPELVEALKEAKDCLQTELNMSNYTHEQVNDLNNESTTAYMMIKTALATLPEELRG